MLNRKSLVLFLLVLLIQFASAQAPSAPSADLEKRVDSTLNKMTLEEKVDYIGGFHDFYVRSIPRLGVPAIKMSDGPIGVRNYGPATTLAGGIALAATWDPDLVRREGAVLGEDARARGVQVLLGPGVNIYRAPMAGRNFEYFGEDPFLAARTAVAYVEGVQSKGVCSTIKHFMGNNQEYDRHNVDSLIDERTMREIYLPTFESAVKQGHVCAIMDSYNLTNGEHMSQNGYLNNEVAKKQWGFDGVIMSDWDSTYDGVAAANGGLDLEMPSGAHMNRTTLLPALKAGKISEATIDDHVRRILRKAVQFGWLDREQNDASIPVYNIPGRAVALEGARSSMVLLKNDGNLLPLDKSKVKTLAIIGPDAYPGQPVGGGSAGVVPFHAMSFLEGVANYAGDGVKVTYSPGIPTLSDRADSTNFTTEVSGGKPGLKFERFLKDDLSGNPAEEGIDTHVNFGFEWPSFYSIPSRFRSSRWTGYYVAKDAGTYDAFLQGPGEDGAYRLFVDDRLVVENWNRATALVNYATMDLAPGPHKIRLELRRYFGDPNLRLGIVNQASVVDPDVAATAGKADAVVVAVGFDPSSESEGADRTFRLPPGQDGLIQAVLAANQNVIVVVTSGGGVDMHAWVHRVPALLQSWYAGQEGGTALAQLLFGEVSPSGKLPVSFDRSFEENAVYKSYYADPTESKKVKYTEGVFVGYRHYDKSSTKPQFPFGYGLSYTTFRYSNLSVTPQSGNLSEVVSVSFDLTNTGTREGAEVAQLYVSDTHSTVPRPVKELKGFAKVNLKPGETRRVTLTLDRRAFSYYDAQKKDWQAQPGDFSLLVGGSSENAPLKGVFQLTR
jgi:beta-glucosidase